MAKKHRSPAYPSIDLPTAIERARVLYEAEKKNPATTDVVLGHWGYQPSSGLGRLVLAALRHFGLLESTGTGRKREVSLTRSALDILLDEVEGSPEREDAIQKVVLEPRIYADLWERCEGGDWPSDASMRTYLVRDADFNPKVVQSLIDDFKRSISFARLKDGDIIEEDEEDIIGSDVRLDTMSEESSKAKNKKTSQDRAARDWTIPLIGGMAVLRAPNPLTDKNFGLIKAWLETMKEALVESGDSQPNKGQ